MVFSKQSKTKEPENANKAYEYAVFLLSLKLRTVGEIENSMNGRGYTPAIIAKTISQLKEQKYLDDLRYAQVYLENLKVYKNFGFYGIKKKFMEKKLPSEIIEKVLAEGLSLDEEIKMAKRLLKKEGVEAKVKLQDEDNQYNTFNEEASKQKQKLAQKLKARGFRGEIISSVIF